MSRIGNILLLALLMSFAGCRTSRNADVRATADGRLALLAECGTCAVRDLRPGWPLAGASVRGAVYGEASKSVSAYRAYWLELRRRYGGNAIPVPSDYFSSQRILNRALSNSKIGPAEKQSLERLLLVHNWEALALQSHNALAEDIQDVEELKTALAAAGLLNTLRAASAEQFATWMPARLQWEALNGDWSGMAWAELFADKTPVSRVPGEWLFRQDSLRVGLTEKWYSQSSESWRNATSQIVSLTKNWQEKLPSGNAPVWLRQSLSVPEGKPPTCLAFRAFPGKCVVYVDGTPAYRKVADIPQCFIVPLPPNGSSRTCQVTIQFPDGLPKQAIWWPIWVATEK